MESGRFLLAVVLMIGVMIITNMLFGPDRQAPGDLPADSLTAIDTLGAPPAFDTSAVVPADSLQAALDTTPVAGDTTRTAAAPVAAALDTIEVETPLLRLGFSSEGGVVSAELLEYEAFGDDVVEGQRVELAPMGESLLDPALVVGQGGQTARVPLRFEATDDSAGVQRVRFAWRNGGRAAVLTWSLAPDDYTLHATLLTRGFAEAPQLQL